MNSASSGIQQLNTYGSDYSSQAFIINSILSKIRTSMLCKVLSVTNDGGVSPVGYVDLQPLVNQVSGAGVAQADGIIHHIPYFRLQGGTNAIIIDPQVGDIGVAVFADRDISSVVNTKAQANPGSARKYHISDGLFLSGFLNSAPAQYIQFNDGGITIFSPNKITVQAGGDVDVIAGGAVSMTASSSITLTAPSIALAGNTAVTGSMMNNGTDIGSTHAHPVSGVQTGSSTVETGPPNE